MTRDEAIDAAALKYVSLAPIEERRAAFLASLRANGYAVVSLELLEGLADFLSDAAFATASFRDEINELRNAAAEGDDK